jgi:protocatechuate 3,4-dioxygenase beta subunit
MRRFSVALVLIVSAAMQYAASQAPELIPPAYLAPQYAAPPDAPSTVVIAAKDEPGDRLVVTGRTLVGTTPVAGVSLYVFHADIEGLYAKNVNSSWAELHPRLYGALRTDGQGRYRYETSRPAGYNIGAAHVHYVVKASGYKPLLIALEFVDDPVHVARRKAGRPALDPVVLNGPVCGARPDCVIVSPVMRDAQGVWQATRDIQMVKE